MYSIVAVVAFYWNDFCVEKSHRLEGEKCLLIYLWMLESKIIFWLVKTVSYIPRHREREEIFTQSSRTNMIQCTVVGMYYHEWKRGGLPSLFLS